MKNSGSPAARRSGDRPPTVSRDPAAATDLPPQGVEAPALRESVGDAPSPIPGCHPDVPIEISEGSEDSVPRPADEWVTLTFRSRFGGYFTKTRKKAKRSMPGTIQGKCKKDAPRPPADSDSEDGAPSANSRISV